MESTTKVFMVTARSDYREWQPRDDEAVHLEAVYSALPSPFSCPAPRRRLGARAHVPLRKKKNTRITPESLNVVAKKRTMVQLTSYSRVAGYRGRSSRYAISPTKGTYPSLCRGRARSESMSTPRRFKSSGISQD